MWLRLGLSGLIGAALVGPTITAQSAQDRMLALPEAGMADPAGSLTVKVNGMPVTMASWVSELSPQHAVAQWRERFQRLAPVLTRHGPWWLTGAPFGDHWLGLQVRAAGQGSVGWQVAMPLAAGAVANERPMQGWPREIPLAGSFESRADGRTTLTQSGRSFGDVGRVASSIARAMQFEGYQTDPSLDKAVRQVPSAGGQRVLRFVKPSQHAAGTTQAHTDQRQDEALAILVPQRSGVLLVMHQIRHQVR